MPIQYLKLDIEAAEIRLLHLAPGEFTDPVRFCLSHASLRAPDPPQRKRLPLEEVQKTLPPGWTVAETEQDKYRFLFEEDETENTTWTHPGPNCDPASWQSLEELPQKVYEPAFEALSYTWGASGSCEKAHVEYRDLEDQTSMDFPMQGNLASALRHLRYPDRTRTLWVDAICINQDDDAEKAHQVKQMWRLYRLCQRVMVWLGPESPNSMLAISTLRHLGAQLEVSRNNWRYRSPQATEMEWFRAVHPLPYDRKTWEAISDFLHRAWFERLWIQLANSQAMVICGREEVPWQSLRRAVTCLEAKQELPSFGLRRRLGLVKMLTLERGSSSVHVLLKISRQRKCFNPKDKIYGMLSICGPTLADKIEPHYSDDWSVADVYQDVSLKHLEQVGRLDLLSACYSALKLGNGPSWVPDWSVPRTTESLSPFVFASGISAAQARYLGRGILQVTGIKAAVVQDVSETAPVDSPEAFDFLRKWEPEGLHEQPYATGESLLDAYCTTIRAGYVEERWPRLSAPSLCEWKEHYLEISSSSSSTGVTSQNCLNDADLFWCLRLIQGRKLIHKEDGYIGLAPSGASPGDLVCILLGCKCLMLLRPVSSAADPLNSEFEVIGDCYVHGLDDGVLLLGPLPKHIKVEIDKSSSGYDANHTYRNIETGEATDEDPRLQPLSETEWERLPRRAKLPDDPVVFQEFKHRSSGEVVNYDPRLLPHALRPRLGTKLRPFNLC